MGQYKVPQDVESEDKLIGPLSLRQFIYIIIALAWAGLMWRIFSWSIIIMIIAIIPVSGFFILLGVGRRQEQSFESYFVAVVRFMFVPRIRVWDKDLSAEPIVKSDVKKPEVVVEKNISRGSLQQLALIMDTYGAQKDPSIQLQDTANQALVYSQRIVNPVQSSPSVNQPGNQRVTATDDVLDTTNTRSSEVNQLLENAEANIYSQAIAKTQQNLQQREATPAPNQQPTQQPTQLQTSDDIIKKAMLQSNNLTIQQLSRQANEQIIPEGQSVNIIPNT